MTEDLLVAIEEMSREKYPCDVVTYDGDEDEYLIVWQDSAGKEWGIWLGREAVEQIFTEEIPN